MREELLEYYERELAYMRQMGAEFGARYPRVASRLLLEPDRCEDPHVERLIESFAFLAARVHLRLEDDFSEATAALLQLIYPHYLQPLPAMTVVEMLVDPAQGKQTAGVVIPRGKQLTTKRTVEGTTCRFRTAYPVELWPVSVAECSCRQPEQIAAPLRVPGAVGVLRVLLRVGEDVVLGTLAMESLQFYLAGESAVTLTLYELLSRNVIRIAARDPKRPDTVVELEPEMLEALGFSDEEALLPWTRRSFEGYRLLQEYFSFPEKFLFFRLRGLARVLAAVGQGAGELELLVYFSRFERPERFQALEVGVTPATLRLGATPAINMFAQAAEPILLTQTQHEYRVIADSRHQAMMEVLSVDSVLATSPSRRATMPIDPLYAFRYKTLSAGSGVFWHAMRRYPPFGERVPSEMHIALVDLNGELASPNAEVLTLHCTCSNHDLPSRLAFQAADGDFEAEGFAGVSRIRALHRPTPSLDPPQGKGRLWRLISQLSLNHLSLSEEGLPAMQEILRLHNFSGSPHLEQQIGGIQSLAAKRHFALVRGDGGLGPARGMQVEMLLDERQFAAGGAYLFSAVLDRFLGGYASLNSFCQLTARTTLRKEALGEWKPRAGNRALL